MAKKFSSHYKTILIVAALALIMVLDVFLAPTKASAARASNSPNRYANPTVVQVDIPEPPAPESLPQTQKQASWSTPQRVTAEWCLCVFLLPDFAGFLYS